MLDTFTGSAFHMGGDEVNVNCWNTTQEITDYMDKKQLVIPNIVHKYHFQGLARNIRYKTERILSLHHKTMKLITRCNLNFTGQLDRF